MFWLARCHGEQSGYPKGGGFGRGHRRSSARQQRAPGHPGTVARESGQTSGRALPGGSVCVCVFTESMRGNALGARRPH